jgi:hypothetical protein
MSVNDPMSTESPSAAEQPKLTDSQAAMLLTEGKDKEFASWLAREEYETEGDFAKSRDLEIRTAIIYAMAGRRVEAKRILRQANAAIQRELIAVQAYGSPEAEQLEERGAEYRDAYLGTLKAKLQDAIRLERELMV